MATQCFLTSNTFSFPASAELPALAGGNFTFTTRLLDTSRGASATSTGFTSITGPTAGIEFSSAFISPPLAADVTISGTITFNIRCAEAAMTANAGAQVVVYWLKADGTIATIVNSEFGTEMTLTTETANNWTASPTSSALKKGDRIAVVVAANDAGGTMAAGSQLTFWYNGTAASASGDSYVTFNETITFQSTTPSGSTIYLTDTASDVATASVDREAWTSRGSGVASDVTNTATGPTAAIQVTDTAGGTVVDWFTKQLSAFTLSGMVLANLRGLESSGSANARLGLEIARVASDGTGATVWADWLDDVELGTSEAALQFYLSGADLAISDGQRLRIRLFVDDFGAMASGFTVTTHYGGTSGGASGDAYLTFSQTLSEVATGTYTPPTASLVTTAFAPQVNLGVVPGVASLTLTAFAPTVTVGARVEPPVASLVTATFAPQLKLVVIPGVASLALSSFAPVVGLTVIPGVASLATVTFAPNIIFGIGVVPGTASLTLTSFAPQVNLVVIPGVASLVTTTFAPTAGSNVVITPGVASLATTTFAPQLKLVVIPGVASLALASFAPQANLKVIPGVASLVTTQFAPSVTVTNLVVVPVASLTTTTFAPQLKLVVIPGVASLTTNRFIPVVGLKVIPGVSSLTTALFVPTVIVGANQTIIPGTASLIIVTFAPTVTTSEIPIIIPDPVPGGLAPPSLAGVYLVRPGIRNVRIEQLTTQRGVTLPRSTVRSGQ